MKVYAVGGCVRDQLLGLPVADRDWVVVGATPDELIRAGYLPVGRDFPVFLHPQTKEEYALARTERKTAPGYHGFVFHAAPDVTLEQDLARRDLTINAMALDAAGRLIDPFDGRADLDARVLRHVGPAFAEDPVRILRVARFAARFADFSVATETRALMRSMVAAGEVDALVPERVWQELARGLMERRPSRMFDVLRDCGALARLLPELGRAGGEHAPRAIDGAARANHPLPVRFAALLLDVGTAEVENVCARLRVPGECRDLALIAAREHGPISRIGQLRAEEILELLERCDALRRPDRFAQLLDVCAADFAARHGEDQPFSQRTSWLAALQAARAVDAGAVAARQPDPRSIPDAVRAARVAAIAMLKG